MSKSKKEEFDRLVGLINQWNTDHYDIFELTKPNENLEFHGAVRFFFQGGIGANVITKCIRVSSTATTKEVIDVLIEKFRPDMRMLSQNKYALYEVHVNGEERRLADDEKPLYVQLNWGTDVREGRFLLRNEDHPTVRDPALGFDKSVLQQDQSGFKRKLSKREKKEIKKREREKGKENVNGDESVANKLYEDAPESSFTRSISNPEAVMRRRRQQKLEKKLAQMNSTDGGADSGGTLKIYGESVRPNVPYKTLFLSTADPASAVVQEALDKYGLEKEDPLEYCLVEVVLPSGGMEYHGESRGDERVLDDNECPLAIVIQHAKRREQGHIIFQLRKRKPDQERRRQKQRSVSHEDLRAHPNDHRHTNLDMLPYLIEMNVRGKPKRHVLPLNVTEVVNVTEVANNKSDYNGKHFLQLSGPDIRPRHCVIAHTEGIVTVTPNSQHAETYVEGQRIYETTMMKHGMTVQFGRDKLYKFLDPRFDEPGVKNQPYQLPNKTHHGHPQETNFDLDGHVETVSGGSSPRPGTLAWDQKQKSSISNRSPTSLRSQGHEDLLPASVEYSLDAEDRLIQASILDVKTKQLQFKLAPTYTLYMAVRHLLSPRSPVTHRAQLVTDFVNKISKTIHRSIQDLHNDPSSLAFWMANSSEILYMAKQDADIYPLSSVSQEMLAEAVQAAFHHLVRCLQGDLQRVMPAFLDPSDASDVEEELGQRYNMGRPSLDDVLDTLSAAMTLLRRCRVNAALTIQLFSQLFHFINMWLFNILVTEPQLSLCTRMWGTRLKRRLGRVETWAEKQGLELAADCHLCRIIQAASLLQAPKSTADDITNISSTCFKLNSLQLGWLLTRYIPEHNEPPVSSSFVDQVVSIAKNMADELTRSDKREVRLEEDNDLHLPFLLPEDGYSCDTIKGIPNGLPEFVKQLESAGLCRFIVNSSASGSWTVYMGDENFSYRTGSSPDIGLPSSPEIITISFEKVKGSMGLSIVAAIGEGQPEQGIYIKSVVEGGAAALDGRLQAGDQLVEVDGKSLIGVTQDKAAELMTKTGQVVKIKVAKQAVLYHNLGSLLAQPSPTSQRAANMRAAGPNRTFSDEGPPPYDGRTSKNINSYGNADKMRTPSSGNLADTRLSGHIDASKVRHDDPRSKSTSNLLVETKQESSNKQANLKAAQSVGMLHPSHGYGQRQGHNDYENQPRYQPAVSQQGKTQTANTSQVYPQSQRNSDRSSMSSRASSNSNKDVNINKDVRPTSAYYNNNNNNITASKESNDLLSRPRSEDIGNKLKEWQDSYDGGHNRHAAGSPPYTNIGSQNHDPPPQPTHNPPPKPTAHERLFSQPGAPQKVNINAYSRQPNFYENTTPIQREPPPAFHQLQRLPNESDIKPYPASKSVVAPPKRNMPRVQHVDVPNIKVDNRQTQPHFYGNARSPTSPVVVQPYSPHKENIMPHFDQRQDQRNASFDQRNLPYDQRNTSFDQRNTQFHQRNSSLDQANAPFDQKNVSNDQRNSFDQRNLQYDQRNTHYDQRNTPYEQRNSEPLQDQRNVQPDVKNGPRFVQDLRNMPDSRNGFDYNGSQQDSRFIQDLRNAPDPRNAQQQFAADSNSQSANARDSFSHQQNARDSFTQQQNARDSITQQQNARNSFTQQQNARDSFTQQQNARNSFTQQQNARDSFTQQQNSRDSFTQQQNSRDSFTQQQNVQNVNSNRPAATHFQEAPRIGQTDHYNNQNQQITDNTNQYSYYGESLDFPPPPLLPSITPPQSDDYLEDLPPLPPPPSNDALIEQRLAAEQLKLMQHINATNQFLAADPRRDRNRNSPNTVQQQQQPIQTQEIQQQPQQPRFQPYNQQPGINRVLPPGTDPRDSTPLGFQKAPNGYRVHEPASYSNYQNINFAAGISSGPEAQVSSEYESSNNSALRVQGFQQVKPAAPPTKPKFRDRNDVNNRSAWDRDAQEKAQEEVKEENFRIREKEITDLKSRPYLSPQDQDRLRKLMMEQEFQRRVKEVSEKGDFEGDDDNDNEFGGKSGSRDGIDSLKEDLERSRERMRQFELTQQKADASREQDRLRILERRLEAYEKEREELTQKKQEIREKTRNQKELERKDKFNVEDSRIHAGTHMDRDGYKHPFDSSNISGHQSSLGYSHFPNNSNVDSSDSFNSAPPPPERNSSYDSMRIKNNANFPSSVGINTAGLPSALKNNTQEPPPPTKKSVSFNTQMNTYKDRTPSHSISSYRSPTGSISADQGFLPVNLSPDSDVFESNSHQMYNNSSSQPSEHFTYNTTSNTPNVIGTQEVYRDPRSRIEAKMASQSSRGTNDRMSFRDKMKLFSPDDTIKLKPKASKTLIDIESQLNGQ